MHSKTRKERKNRTNFSFTYLSGYQLMWMFVLFDLPVVEKEERKTATAFRNFLLDEGFSMTQYSVYNRLLSGKEAVEKYSRKIFEKLPEEGKVDIICITDKQYENILSYNARKGNTQKKQGQQLLLF